jgi:hypothetical protein
LTAVAGYATIPSPRSFVGLEPGRGSQLRLAPSAAFVGPQRGDVGRSESQVAPDLLADEERSALPTLAEDPWEDRPRYEMSYDLMLYWPDVRPCWLEDG